MRQRKVLFGILAAAITLLAVIGAGCAGVAEATLTYADVLFDLKNPYVGDASANGALLSALEFPSSLGAHTMELVTDQEPYALRLVFAGTATENVENTLQRNGLILLSLIENVSQIQWRYQALNPDTGASETRTGALGIDEANAVLPDGDVKAYAQSAKTVQALLADVANAATALCSEATPPLALPAIQAERMEDYFSLFAYSPRGEDGFSKSYTGDWDGDDLSDRAELLKTPSPIEGYTYQHCIAIFFGNGEELMLNAESMETMSEWGGHGFLLEAADLTGDGQNELLILADLGGQGGRGSFGMYPFIHSGDGWVLMDAPYHGYNLTLTWEQNIATVTSGDYNEVIGDAAMIKAHYAAAGEAQLWNEVNGISYESEYAADAVCDLALTQAGDRTEIIIAQYTTGMTGIHADELGYLLTTLRFCENGALLTADKRFVLYPQ